MLTEPAVFVEFALDAAPIGADLSRAFQTVSRLGAFEAVVEHAAPRVLVLIGEALLVAGAEDACLQYRIADKAIEAFVVVLAHLRAETVRKVAALAGPTTELIVALRAHVAEALGYRPRAEDVMDPRPSTRGESLDSVATS